MANEDVQPSGEWDWLEESPLRIGCALIFARDVPQDEAFKAEREFRVLGRWHPGDTVRGLPGL